MKLKVNYTIEDMFKHKQQITAEKDSPRYIDFITIIDKMPRLKPYDYVLFIEFEDDTYPLTYATIYYDNMDELKQRTLTVEYHGHHNDATTVKNQAGQVKAWIGDYMKDNGLMQD